LFADGNVLQVWAAWQRFWSVPEVTNLGDYPIDRESQPLMMLLVRAVLVNEFIAKIDAGILNPVQMPRTPQDIVKHAAVGAVLPEQGFEVQPTLRGYRLNLQVLR
jgi:hypothetical protein